MIFDNFHIIFLSVQDINKFISECYILLNNKTEWIYNESIEYIKSKICTNNKGCLNVKTVTCDFEQGLINAIKNNFIDVTIVGCYFHKKKCLIRKAVCYK